ncbi:MAG: DUF1153 domain-containing protein [Pseudomonadota bacterium]
MSDVISFGAANAAPDRSERRRQQLLTALPPSDTRRWVASRKAAVVAAVNYGALKEEDALKRYGLSAEEFESWRASLKQHGVGALRTTRIQAYR